MSQPPQYPGYPNDPEGGYPNPAGYPPPSGYGPPGYPPPPPGYPPGGYPPAGGYPPPPVPPGPGYPPGGYPPAGYPPPPGFAGPPSPRFDIGDAFSWSFNKFGKHAVALIAPLLGYALLVATVGGIWLLALTSTDLFGGDTSEGVSGRQLVVLFLGYVTALLTAMFVQAAYLSGCLDIADGRPVTIGSFFRPRNFGAALVTALLVGLLAAVGAMLFVIPGLIVGFLTQFAVAFAIDRSLAPIDTFKASFATCQANIGGALLSWVVQLVVLLAGQMLCGVGLLVAFPLAVLIQTYTYRRLSGGWLAPAQP